MTNEEAKNEAIKKAYGEQWEIVKDKVDIWGRLSYMDAYDLYGDDFYFSKDSLSYIWKNDFDGYYCPEDIYDLSLNNGWTRIEADGSNLPIDDNVTYLMCWNGKPSSNPTRLNAVLRNWAIFNPKNRCHQTLTHYKPIEEDKPPIY